MEYIKIKRLLDIILALSLAISLSPILLLTAVLIKLDSKGPIIFKQQRLGKNGDFFNIYKFRSMASDNNMYNFEEKDKVTRIGKFLRRTGIDEIPQIFNILKGEMSFVGPRPQPATYMNFYTEEQKKYLQVLPGILGHNTYTYTKRNIIEKNNIEIQYVDNFSLKQDIEIILTTIKNAPKIFLYRKESSNGNKQVVEEDLKILKNNHDEENKKTRSEPIKYVGEEITADLVNKFKEISKLRYDPVIFERYFSDINNTDDFFRQYQPFMEKKDNINMILGQDWFFTYSEHEFYIEVLEWVALDKVDNKLLQIKEMLNALRELLVIKVKDSNIPKIIIADMRHDSSYKFYKKALDKGYIVSQTDELFYDRAIPEVMEESLNELRGRCKNISEFHDRLTEENEQEYYKYLIHHVQFYTSDNFIEKYTRSRKKN